MIYRECWFMILKRVWTKIKESMNSLVDQLNILIWIWLDQISFLVFYKTSKLVMLTVEWKENWVRCYRRFIVLQLTLIHH